MHRFVFHNDRIQPLEEVRLSPGQAGLLNGWGLFTTSRINDGRPFAWERHWKRLQTDAARIGMPFPFDREQVRKWLEDLLRSNQVGVGLARVYMIHNKIGAWSGSESMPEMDLLMFSGPMPSRVGPTNLTIQKHGRNGGNPLANVKVISWLYNIWVVEEAHKQGFDEALLLNERDEVTECAAANFFCVRGGVVYTPPLSSGCLPGVSREILLEEVGQAAGVSISEKALTLKEVLEAEEIFISSTSRDVQPVNQIDERKFAAPGPVTERLAKAFAEYVTRYFGQPALTR